MINKRNETSHKADPITDKYTLGLDIGIASVGWAVLANDHIIDLGVRTFDKAETEKGESLNLARRNARLMRNRLRRRASRLKRLRRLFKDEGLVIGKNLFQTTPNTQSPWQLRVEGLDRRLGNEEWARVVYHICKHRGFHWISRADRLKEEGDGKGEGGKVTKGLAETKHLREQNNYRTAAEMVLAEFPDAQRNKRGDYNKSLARLELSEELALLFERQREFGNPHAGASFEQKILGNGDRKSGLFWEQQPPLSGEKLLDMLGHCTFEKMEYRAPKASFSAERHVWLTKLNNLRIFQDGDSRPLNDAERRCTVPLPYQRKGKFTYKQLRRALVKKNLLDDDFKFAGLRYGLGRDGKEQNPESATIVDLKGWHEIRKTLEKAKLAAEWNKVREEALVNGESVLLDKIAWILSVYKEDDEAKNELTKLSSLTAEMTDALLSIRFDKFSNLSLKALRNILPHMASGLRYDEACRQVDYSHSQPGTEKRQRLLPSLYHGKDPKKNTMLWNKDLDIPRNPVVLRAINQARKVINALVRKYGPPQVVHIEMARDLSRPKSERDKVTQGQQEYRKRNETARDHFEEVFKRKPSSKELNKWLLYKEQDCKCAYSLRPLDLSRVVEEEKYAEVDHILPYSRSYDDSKNNKVLSLSKENQNKGNRTPYEYLGGESSKWREFKAFVESNKSFRQAKRSRLLRKNFGENEAEGFRERNLNDTRYIGRFLKNYIEQHLELADGSDNRRCVVLNGRLTSFLRARWGLLKIRTESDRHHALDAVVVAACSHSMVKRLGDYSRRKELEFAEKGLIDFETGAVPNPNALHQLERDFPLPWPNFRNEVQHRLKIDDPKKLREKMAEFGTYSANELGILRPIFVSRAPQRRNGGAAHKETVYAQPEHLKEQGSVTQRIELTKLNLKSIDQLVDPHRNKRLYAAIRDRLEEHDDQGDRAFPADRPMLMPGKDGRPTGPVVRSVSQYINTMSGIPVRGGVARNDIMLRTDVFTKEGKFYLVPVYVHHRVKSLPDKAIVGGKKEEAWTQIDRSYDFLFSLHPNDFVEVEDKDKGNNRLRAGYYAGCDRSTGAIHLLRHDRGACTGGANAKGIIRSIGVKTALSLRKFHVDVLGHRYPAPKENRKPLQ